MAEGSVNEALIACVRALGGSKQVGPLLWPDIEPLAAQRKLLDCLNDDRPHHLTPSQVVFVLRRARGAGVHTGMEHLCAVLGYAPPVPVAPQDEAAELQRQFVQAQAGLMDLVSRMEMAGAWPAAPVCGTAVQASVATPLHAVARKG